MARRVGSASAAKVASRRLTVVIYKTMWLYNRAVFYRRGTDTVKRERAGRSARRAVSPAALWAPQPPSLASARAYAGRVTTRCTYTSSAGDFGSSCASSAKAVPYSTSRAEKRSPSR